MTDVAVRWLRFLPRTHLQFAANNQALMVFVSVQPWHFSELGVATQELLSGPGEVDSKIETMGSLPGHWSKEMALNYCEASLNKLAQESQNDVLAGELQYMIAEIEALASKSYGRQQVLLNGLISQEIIIPAQTWTVLIADAAHDAPRFHLLNLVGLQSLRTQTFDMQPSSFRTWFLKVLSGEAKPPGKKPKSFALYLLHRTIVALVKRLKTEGIDPTTSRQSDQGVSGCGLVARAVANAGLTQPRSYEGVRNIWAKRNKHFGLVGNLLK